MKRTLAILLTLAFLATMIAVPVTASPANNNYGNVLKVNEGDINMGNAEKDAAFAAVSPIAILDRHDGDPGEIATGTAWMVWSDAAYYVYAEVSDPTVFDNEITANAWETDSFEIFFSFVEEYVAVNDVNASRSYQYRIDRNNFPSSFPHDGDWGDEFLVGSGDNVVHGVGDNADKFQWSSRQYSGGYAVKFRVSMLGAPKAGEIGMHFQVNDRDEFGGGVAGQPIWPAGNEASSWAVADYGYVTLVDELAIPPAAADPEPAADDGKADDEAPPAVVDTPAPRPSPRTSDAGVTALIALMAIAAAGIVVLRKRIN